MIKESDWVLVEEKSDLKKLETNFDNLQIKFKEEKEKAHGNREHKEQRQQKDMAAGGRKQNKKNDDDKCAQKKVYFKQKQAHLSKQHLKKSW